MSKCQEEFEESGCKDYDTWRIAWNIRGKVDAEICKTYIVPGASEYGDGNHDMAVWVKEAIEQEDEK